jgi:hypothetical protein
MSYRPLLIVLGLAASTTPSLLGQDRWGPTCRDDYDDRWGERHCSIETRTLRPGGILRINAHPNGGVTVVGWDRREIGLKARVQARARDADRAEEIARSIQLNISGTDISVDGPRTRGRESWWVSFEVRVPRDSDLWVRAQNGGIEVTGVRGEMDLGTVNGGLELKGVGGEVQAETTNGGVLVELDGTRWDGEGLTVRTINGGVELAVPARYSAELEAGTVNGGIDFEFPVEIRGRLSRRITTTLGNGGPPIRVSTTNGGVTIRRD